MPLLGLNLLFSDLNEIFSFVFNKSMESKFIFVIDEFGYLAKEFPEVTSLLQHYVDSYKNKVRCCLFFVHRPEALWRMMSLVLKALFMEDKI